MRNWIKAKRLAWKLWRFRVHTRKAKAADVAYCRMLTGMPARPKLTRAEQLVPYVGATSKAPDIVWRACAAIAERLTPSSVSLRAMTGGQVGRRRRPCTAPGAVRESAPPRSTTQLDAAPARVTPAVDTLTDSMCGRIEYVHREADSSDMGAWLDFIAGHDDAPVAPVVEQPTRRGRHVRRRSLVTA